MGPTMGKALLEVQDLWREFPSGDGTVAVLKGIDLRIEAGQPRTFVDTWQAMREFTNSRTAGTAARIGRGPRTPDRGAGCRCWTAPCW